MSSTLRLVAGLVLCLVSCTAASVLQADVVRVAVASNFSGVLEQLGPMFTDQSGHELILSPGASGAIFTQIVNGAPFDVFFSADMERPRQLVTEGHGTGVHVYAVGHLVLWSAQPDLVTDGSQVLARANWRHLAIANPAQAPYGLAAEQTLHHLGLWDTVQTRLVQGDNITQTLQFVQTGNAELGFIAASQYVALPGDARGSAWPVPDTHHAPLLQGLVVLRDSPAAQALLEFLGSGPARRVIESAGYSVR